jgi:pyruvate dehydrogenase E1 component alpha subunit
MGMVAAGPPAPVLIEMLRRMWRVRCFDLAIAGLIDRDLVPGSSHSSIGQEATVVGACMAIRVSDSMTGNHRSHGHPIGKGASLGPLMAEVLGRATGVCKGKGGSMHLADFSVGSLGESGIVGGAIPVATGAGLSAKLLGDGRVCLCFFGDGAANEGTFHESLNLAAAWRLPVVYLCENNLYACTVPARTVTSVVDIATRAQAYGIPGVVVDGQDVVAVHAAVERAAARARQDLGPTLVEAKTYRFREHAEGMRLSVDLPYRSQEEVGEWMARDPIARLRDRLVSEGILSDAEADAVDVAARAEIAEAVAFAEHSPMPSPEQAFEDLYAEPVGSAITAPLEAS